MKVCKICCELKDDVEFRPKRNQCKKCISNKYKEYHQNYYKDNKDFLSFKMKQNYLDNLEDRKTKNSEYREKNKELLNEYGRTYRIENSDKIKEYRIKNKDILREYNSQYWAKRMREDNLFRLKSIMRKSIGNLVKNKNEHTEQIIVCSFEELKVYLESKFDNWMNWDNYGVYNGEYNFGWDIDHIIPLSSAKNQEDIYKLCHYSNLQPMCSRVNRYEKRDKLI